jgi:phosphoribosylanthranilate isomerase
LSEVLVKVCGLTSAENALACVEVGADWIGLNFHPPSPRSVSLDRAVEIAREFGVRGLSKLVGLFVNRPVDEVADTLVAARPMVAVQFHGDEPPEYLLNFVGFKPPLQIVRAFRLASPESVDQMVAYLERAERLGCPPDAILVDAHVAGVPGGTGKAIADDLLDRLPPHPRLILAGGLNPENVAERVARVRPWMVDVAGGVESSPGVKDVAKVAAFVAAARRG